MGLGGDGFFSWRTLGNVLAGTAGAILTGGNPLGAAAGVALFEGLYDYGERGSVGHAVVHGAVAGGVTYVGGKVAGAIVGKFAQTQAGQTVTSVESRILTPGAATPAVQPVAQVVVNGTRGRAFERAAIAALGATKNTATLQGQSLAGATVSTIPDVVQVTAITEIKDVISLSYTKQLQAQVNIAVQRGIPYNLIVGMKATVSSPLQTAVRLTGGIIQRFNPTTRTFLPYP
jgi:hypothetical protein